MEEKDTIVYVGQTPGVDNVVNYHKKNLQRDVFIEAINESGLKRIIWVSENDTNKNILELDNLIYLKHKDYKGVEEKILDLESQETVEYGLIDLET